MGIVDDPTPTPGESNVTAQADVRTLLAALKAEFNGNIDSSNLSAALRAEIGLSGRGYVQALGTAAVVSSTSYEAIAGFSFEIPTIPVIAVQFFCDVTESSAGASRTAIYVDGVRRSNELTIGTTSPQNAASCEAGLNITTAGLWIPPPSLFVGNLGEVEIGIYAKTSTGTVTFSNLHLNAWVMMGHDD